MSLRLALTAAALCLGATAAHAQSQAAAACTTRDRCLDAILDAARGGRQIEQLALTRELRRSYAVKSRPGELKRPPPSAPIGDTVGVGDPAAVLQALLRNQKDEIPWLPERRRALALAYLQAGRLPEAELELDEALADEPTYAPYWLDLAVLHARRGRPDQAVAALLVADGWALDAQALRQAWVQASQPATAEMAPLYARALQLIAANDAAQAGHETALAPLAARKSQDGKPAPMPTIVFKDCQPDYPKPALAREQTGALQLGFLVDADGTVRQIRKQGSSGVADLDNAALLALSGCGFKPLVVDGKPVASWAQVQYVWTLE